MNPQPPVTRIRTAPSNSGDAGALADFPTLRECWTLLADSEWTPWVILMLAAFLRFFLLGMKPPHFDEGINGWFVDQMMKNGFYRYDPTNYHGPLHFYVLLVSQALFGRNLWALRLPVVLVSIASVWATLKFEPVLGRTTSRLAALAMAISPGFVFYGRYCIHEVWLVFFSMLFILGLLGLWKFGTRAYLWYAGMGLAGMILTKETYAIHVACAAIAVGVTWLSSWRFKIYRRRSKEPVKGIVKGWLILFFVACAMAGFFFRWPVSMYVWLGAGLCAVLSTCIPANLIGVFYRARDTDDARPAKQTWDLVDLAAVGFVGIAAVVFLYSGTFFHWSGVKGLYQAYSAWFETGKSGHGHEKPWFYWLKLTTWFEAPLLAGLLVCVFCQRFKNISLRYLAIYGVGTFVAYSLVHYKTPWCVISIIWPFGFTFAAMLALAPLRNAIKESGALVLAAAALLVWIMSKGGYKEFGVWPFALAGGVVVLLVVLRYSFATYVTSVALLLASFGSMIWLNFFHCTDESQPYVYVQTFNDVFKLSRPLLKLAHRDPAYYQMIGHFIRNSAYPFPWVLGDFPNIGYYEKGQSPGKVDADFLLVQQDRIQEIEAKLEGAYYTTLLTIRPYQDTSKVYFRAEKFKEFFPNRPPDFKGKGPG